MKERETKKRWGDRRDGRLLRELDAMHFIMPLIYPNRCDNEAYVSERIDLTNINEYLKKLNENETQFRYTMFHLIVTAMVKTITLRPKLNRFIANGNMYQRNEVSAAFTVKKYFADEAEEALAFLHISEEDTLQSIHEILRQQIFQSRKERPGDSTTDSMDFLNKMPRFLSKALIKLVCFLEKRGLAPAFLLENDPYYSSVVLSNVGSIKLKSGYHHLTNWGTCSVFCLIGEKKMTPSFAPDGTVTMVETVDLGLTIDERLADGYYYSKSVKLLKYLLQNPWLLERPMKEMVDYE